MRLGGFFISPQAREILATSGLEARIERKRKSRDGVPYLGNADFEDDIRDEILDLKRRGFYDAVPAQGWGETYRTTLPQMLRNPEEFYWEVDTPAGLVRLECELDDVCIFSGGIAQLILKKNEMWDYKKFGFSSPTELVGVVSLRLYEVSEGLGGKGYSWERKQPDGTVLRTEITGDMHSDFRLVQEDVTAYPVRDPFGATTGMRPEMTKTVAAYHSVEPEFLAAVLRYADHVGVTNQVFPDNGEKILAWARSLGQHMGTAASMESGWGLEHTVRSSFISYPFPLPELSATGEAKGVHYSMPCQSEGSFGIFVDGQDLAIAYVKDGRASNAFARFSPEDVEDLVKGVLFQAAHAQGRTSVRTLVTMLEYRFTPQFQEDQRKHREYLKDVLPADP